MAFEFDGMAPTLRDGCTLFVALGEHGQRVMPTPHWQTTLATGRTWRPDHSQRRSASFDHDKWQ